MIAPSGVGSPLGVAPPSGPLDTTMATFDPTSASPPSGSCEITKPLGTSSDGS